MIPDVIGRPLFSRYAMELQASEKQAEQRALAALRKSKDLMHELRTAGAVIRRLFLHQNFLHWKILAVREKAWKSIGHLHRERRDATLVKAKAFFAWKGFAAVHRQGQVLTAYKQLSHDEMAKRIGETKARLQQIADTDAAALELELGIKMGSSSGIGTSLRGGRGGGGLVAPMTAIHPQSTAVLAQQQPNSAYRDWETDRKSTRLNSSHEIPSRMPSSA